MAVVSFRERVGDCDHLYLTWCSRVLFPGGNPTFFNEWIMSPKTSKRSWIFIGATIYKIRLLIILKMFYILCSTLITLLLICPQGSYVLLTISINQCLSGISTSDITLIIIASILLLSLLAFWAPLFWVPIITIAIVWPCFVMSPLISSHLQRITTLNFTMMHILVVLVNIVSFLALYSSNPTFVNF